MPVNAPVEELNDNQLGTVVPASVTESPASTSLVVTVYEYALSSVADVTAVDVNVGASLTLATAIVND